jgi:hypothetical protein
MVVVVALVENCEQRKTARQTADSRSPEATCRQDDKQMGTERSRNN